MSVKVKNLPGESILCIDYMRSGRMLFIFGGLIWTAVQVYLNIFAKTNLLPTVQKNLFVFMSLSQPSSYCNSFVYLIYSVC